MAWRPDYATTAQVKAFLGIGDSVDDTELASAITAASRAIDRATSRQFGQVDDAEQRSYRGIWDRHQRTTVVNIDDLGDITDLEVEVEGEETLEYVLHPVNALLKGSVYTELHLHHHGAPNHHNPEVLVTGMWGWPAVPVAILQACKTQAGRFFKRKDALFGVAGSPSDGSEMRLLALIDPDVKVMVTDYMRRWGAV